MRNMSVDLILRIRHGRNNILKEKIDTTKNYIDSKQKLKQADDEFKQIKTSDPTKNLKLILENQDLLTEIQIQDGKNGKLTIENKHQKKIIKEIMDKNEILKVLNKELMETNNLIKIKRNRLISWAELWTNNR